jgi:hypothetical protein
MSWSSWGCTLGCGAGRSWPPALWLPPSGSSIVVSRTWRDLIRATRRPSFPDGNGWSNGGSNPQQTSGPCVAKSAESARENATEDDARPLEVLALSDPPNGSQLTTDPIDAALADALSRAARAGRFDVVAQLALELEARRRARTGNVVSLGAKRRDGGP